MDALGKALLFLTVFPALLGFVFSFFPSMRTVRAVIGILEWGFLIFFLFRFFSRNREKRVKENGTYLRITGPIRKKWEMLCLRFRDRKEAVYRTCPACRATLRLPRRKGKHTARCPRCSNRFDVRILF